MEMRLPDAVAAVLGRLEERGFRADVVGGGVRDALRGVPSHDFDVTTEATPEEIKTVFADRRTVDTGIRHGTVTVLWDGVPYEITTWRLDGDYADHRHPDGVIFTKSLAEDLVRRDFTMNAIAYSPAHGLTDLFGGEADIRDGLIRAVGDPDRRFGEDALRILRALRFAATLGFRIEENTLAAARRCAPSLTAISVERVLTEWNKAIAGGAAYDVFAAAADIWEQAIPELRGAILPARDAFLAATPAVRTLALFAHLGAEGFAAATERLHSDGATRKNGFAVLKSYENAETETRAGLLRLCRDLGEECARLAVGLRVLKGIDAPQTADRLCELLAEKPPYRIGDLAVRGDDLIARGVTGAAIGETLACLLDRVIDGELPNERERLLRAVTEI